MASAAMPGSNGRCAGERRDRPNVSVIIPALNEAENLRELLPRLSRDYEIVLVDGASTDGTVETALELREDVRIVQQDGKGKGNAVACGFAAAGGEIIVMLDADGSARPEEIDAFVAALVAGADFAKGSRFLSGGGSSDITRMRRLGNHVLGMLVNLLYSTHYTDLCYGFNAFWSRCLPVLDVHCDGFEVETLLNIRAAKARLNVVEVPSFEDSRVYGRSNLRPVADGWRVLRTIARERFRRTPAIASEAVTALSPTLGEAVAR